MDYMACLVYSQCLPLGFCIVPLAFSLLPSTFTNKRHEIATTQVLYPVSLPQPGNPEQVLLPSRPNRDYQSPTPSQLLQENFGHSGSTGRDYNSIVRRS